ncbi:predicted protein [Naegleria gruberi]|uniref:Predicted protein n=1 Tax=Naegleria gruberi TaxID=5762 RepID=D2W1I7_NAEGR|nr:uncharacterized protein NAEGRDRAFT_75235 [Naegleria gruberi]EFC37097.1 predicted protein [Naegleria gruberi]|eukprot:XP_002669841.1 predicted protein [Naegleria gruberi strain NEG-M]
MSLNKACMNGDVSQVQLILSGDEVVDINDQYSYSSPLYAACKLGNIAIVELLLATGRRVNINKGVHCYTDYCSNLFAAYTRGFRDIVKLLLTIDGINVNDGCYLMSTSFQHYDKQDFPLYYACKIGDYEMVKWLLKFEDIEVNRAIFNYDEPTNNEYVYSTLEHDSSDYPYLTTPLYAACKRGYLEIVKLLLQFRNISVNEGEVSPLYAAIMGNYIEIIECLLYNGALVDEKCEEAAQEMDIDIESILLRKTITLFKTLESNVFGKHVWRGDIYIETSKGL